MVTLAHVVLLLVGLILPSLPNPFEKPRKLLIPVEFTIAVPPAEVPDSAAARRVPDRNEPPQAKPTPVVKDDNAVTLKQPTPVPTPRSTPKPKTTPTPSSTVKPGAKSTAKPTTKPTSGLPGGMPGGKAKAQTKPLTAEEIQRFLSLGAKMGETTSIPDDETIQLLRIHDALFEAWQQPSAEEAGGRVVEVAITLREDGMILDRKLKRKSGNQVLDESVLKAVNSVPWIRGLPIDFVRRHKVVTIEFKVE